jgi:integrase
MAVTLSQAVDDYLMHCLGRGLEHGTIRARRSALKLMLDVVGDIQVRNIAHRHLDEVFAFYPWQASTRNTKLSVYRSFFIWCRARGLIRRDHDPLFGWRSVTVPQVDRTRIPVQEWAKLFSAVGHPIERIVLATGLYLFLRSSEQQQIRIKHVHLADGEIEIYRPKTKDWDLMPISLELDHHLREHLTWLAEQGACEPENYLIPARDRNLQRVQNRWVAGTGGIDTSRPIGRPSRHVQRILERCGYDTQGQGEHTLRRSGARAYFDQLAGGGYDGALRRVQAMLGHKSSQMTEIYLGLDLDRRARNEAISGQPMFPELYQATSLRAVHG